MAFMIMMTHVEFHFNGLMTTKIFSIRASEPPQPGNRLKRPGLIGLTGLKYLSEILVRDFVIHECSKTKQVFLVNSYQKLLVRNTF